MHKWAKQIMECVKAKVDGIGIDNFEEQNLDDLKDFTEIAKNIACFDKDYRIVEAISLAIAVDGEPLQSTRMIVTPAAVSNMFNVSAQAYVDVPCGCCSTVAVQNTSTQAIEVQNSNLIAVREA